MSYPLKVPRKQYRRIVAGEIALWVVVIVYGIFTIFGLFTAPVVALIVGCIPEGLLIWALVSVIRKRHACQDRSELEARKREAHEQRMAETQHRIDEAQLERARKEAEASVQHFEQQETIRSLEAQKEIERLRRELAEASEAYVQKQAGQKRTYEESKARLRERARQYRNEVYSFGRYDGTQYEHYVARRLMREGFTDVKVTQQGHDYGVDVMATAKDGTKTAVQCKLYSSPVGVEAVQQVLGGCAMYGCKAAVVCSNNDFTKEARTLAHANGVRLVPHYSPATDDSWLDDDELETMWDLDEYN